MPFPEQDPQEFTRQNIEKMKLNQSGVYGLYRTNYWIYIGKGDIRQRLLDHFNGDNPCISKEQPTHWVAAIIGGDPSAREKQLITEFQPLCNQRVG